MNALRDAALVATLSLAAPAPVTASTAFLWDGRLVVWATAGFNQAGAEAAAAVYFGCDMFITLGAFALAGGALAVFGTRRLGPEPAARDQNGANRSFAAIRAKLAECPE